MLLIKINLPCYSKTDDMLTINMQPCTKVKLSCGVEKLIIFFVPLSFTTLAPKYFVAATTMIFLWVKDLLFHRFVEL